MSQELGRRLGVEVRLTGAPNPQSVIDAVRNGQADIGFVAYNPERAGPVEFSQPYLLVQQTFAVRQDSAIRSVADIDRPNQRIGAGKGDSVALYLARTLKQAQLVEISESTSAEAMQTVIDRKLDAIGANRQRLTDAVRTASALRVLPDDLYGVEQTIIVPNGKPDALKAINAFIDDIRRSGFLQTAIERSRVIGITMAPPRTPEQPKR
jgi:polar amino acid transport system substrate-binding protein